METEDAPIGAGSGSQTGGSATRASLQLELRVPDRQMLATIRDAVLRWLNDRSGPLANAIGFGNHISLDEEPPTSDAHGMSTMRLTVSWPVAKAAVRVNVNSPHAVEAARVDMAAPEPADSFVFVPCASLGDAPLHADFPEETEAPAPPYPRLWRRRRSQSVAAKAASGVATASSAIHAFAQESMRGLRPDRLMIRIPTLATHPRAWTLALLGSATVATGFVVGSFYLGTSGRPDNPGTPPPVLTAATVGVVETAPAVTKIADTMTVPGATADDSATPKPPPAAPTEPASRAAQPRPQPGERPAAVPDRLRQSTPEERPAARTTQLAQAGADPEVPTTGIALPGDEVIGSAPLPDSGLVRPVNARRAQIAVVRAADLTGAPSRSGLAADKQIRGTLLVKSDPQGAEVSINGVVHGRTPLMIRDLGVGSRVVRLELPGYERWSWAVAVVANKRTPLNVKLRPDSRGVSNPD